MASSEFRSLSNVERLILDRMMQVSIPENAALREQIAAATVRTLDEFGSLGFKVDRDRRPARVADGPILTAVQPDEDTVENFGPYINYTLFVKDGFITELQIYKDDGNKIMGCINPGSIAFAFPSQRSAKEGQ